jgi:ATP-dependent DNA helicase RecQ
VIAVTATATPRVLAELVRSLQLRDAAIVRGDFRRPNLAFSVRHVTTDDERYALTIDALERAGLRGRSGPGRAIIYCATRKKTEAVATHLKGAGFAVGHYHAGRTALARDRMHTSFASGRTRVLVATSAFGMGVDYPDVRVTIHFQAPGSVEAYYQEAGRAGRDGEPAQCLLLYGAGDLVTQRRIAESGRSRRAGLDEALAAVARYATSWTCRQQMLCAHFTGTDDHAACGRCDVCRDPAREHRPAPAVVAATVLGATEQQIILAAITAHGRAVGKGNLAKALRGSHAKPVVVQQLDRLAQHGVLAACEEHDIVATIEQLVRDRRLVRRGKKYPTGALPRSAAPPRTSRTASRSTFGRRGRDGSRGSSITVELDRFRKQMARKLKWKPYMIFQRATIAALDRVRPQSLAALASIPGLGPNRIARFGDELLAIIRRYGGAPDTHTSVDPEVRDLFSELSRE